MMQSCLEKAVVTEKDVLYDTSLCKSVLSKEGRYLYLIRLANMN